MAQVHYCVFCGWHRDGEAVALLAPTCDSCGSALKAGTHAELERMRAEAQQQPSGPPSKSADITGLFAGFAAVPMFLPLLGVRMGALVFGVPLIILIFGAARAAAAARRNPEHRWMWRWLTVGSGLAAMASALGIVSPLSDDLPLTAFYVGSAASVALVAAMVQLTRQTLTRERLDGLVDAALFMLLLTALGIHFVVLPGFAYGDVLLTIVFAVDLAAVLLAVASAIARRGRRHRRVAWPLVATCVAAAGGDALVTAATAGQIGAAPSATALLWAAAGFALAWAADEDAPAPGPDPEPSETFGLSWMLARVVLPLTAVLAFPCIVLALWAGGGLDPWSFGYFGSCFIAALVLAFGRQAYLIVDNRRAMARERKLREEATRRNKELEALTGLATTMTQTLEEAPIIEQALTVLHLAARAGSSALHTGADGTCLRATSGNWHGEHAWCDRLPEMDDAVAVDVRGRRQIVRLRLHARGHDIGVVTLLRPISDTFEEQELKLLGLLVDQLAVAVQNARDYREKLEQAIRDPLTGIYNRRFFFEAFEKEVRRSERYGSEVSLVIFDVDDFKQLNDTFGHAAGDDVLRGIGRTVSRMIRPVDSFARIGGEEFALLLPETKQFDALLVAERVRTAISRQQILPDTRVTVSGGVASCPHDATTLDALQSKADAALYWSKRSGKDMCAVASEVTDAGQEQDVPRVLAHLYGVVDMIDAQHLNTRDHSENVASYAVAIGQELGLTPDRIMKLRRAAFLHDVGKVAVGRDILMKPAVLSDAELEEIKAHPGVGASLLIHAGLDQEGTWVRSHHEQVDGGGYPDGLSGEEIPLESRIIFVADAFEAMTADRPYRAGMNVSSAVAELGRCAGTQFDPRIVEILVELVENGGITVLAVHRRGLSAGARASAR
jgi:diguanylate cyclase (GGDEF)-like protein